MKRNWTSQSGFQIGGGSGDLFRGAACYYAAFRRPYPPQVVSYMVDTFGLDGRGRLLDAGCGTGQVFSVLAQYFAETFAFDQDAEMVALARESIGEAKPANIHVQQMKAEAIASPLGTFKLATFGASFHWMDRQQVGDLVYDVLEPGGHIAVLAPGGLHTGSGPLELAIRETISEFLGPERRAGSGLYLEGERHAQALARTRFGNPTTVDIYVEERWDIDQIIGWLYSTSFANRTVLGDHRDAFEAALRVRLTSLSSSGSFARNVEYSIIWAARP